MLCVRVSGPSRSRCSQQVHGTRACAWDLLSDGAETAVAWEESPREHIELRATRDGRAGHLPVSRLIQAPGLRPTVAPLSSWTAEAGSSQWPQPPTPCPAMARVPTSLLPKVSAAPP